MAVVSGEGMVVGRELGHAVGDVVEGDDGVLVGAGASEV